MEDLLIWFVAYLTAGVITSGIMSYMEWARGDDITLADLWMVLVRAVTWPLGVFVLITNLLDQCKPFDTIVLIRGSRSAKMLRELRRNNDD